MSITSVKSGATGISLALDNNFMEPIATTLVGSGGANTVIFNDIPQGYKHLQLRGIARDNRSANAASNMNIVFNSDTGSNYRTHYLSGNGVTPTAADDGVGTAAFIARVGGASAAASSFGAFIVDILDYTNTNKNKTVRALSGIEDNTTNASQIYFNSSLWLSTLPISTITLFGVGNTIQQYSRFSLYGIKG